MLLAVMGATTGPPARPQNDVPANVTIWGCERTIPSNVVELDPGWREGLPGVGDFRFDPEDPAWRRHEDADYGLKLPVIIEGHSGATVWIPRHERDRVALILSVVPRSGPGNSYRVEDGLQRVRFEPCAGKNWSAWTAGLALADPRAVVLNVSVDGAPEPERVALGPWPRAFTIDRG